MLVRITPECLFETDLNPTQISLMSVIFTLYLSHGKVELCYEVLSKYLGNVHSKTVSKNASVLKRRSYIETWKGDDGSEWCRPNLKRLLKGTQTFQPIAQVVDLTEEERERSLASLLYLYNISLLKDHRLILTDIKGAQERERSTDLERQRSAQDSTENSIPEKTSHGCSDQQHLSGAEATLPAREDSPCTSPSHGIDEWHIHPIGFRYKLGSHPDFRRTPLATTEDGEEKLKLGEFVFCSVHEFRKLQKKYGNNEVLRLAIEIFDNWIGSKTALAPGEKETAEIRKVWNRGWNGHFTLRDKTKWCYKDAVEEVANRKRSQSIDERDVQAHLRDIQENNIRFNLTTGEEEVCR